VTTGALRHGFASPLRVFRLKMIAAVALCAAAAYGAWTYLAPPQVGGATSLAIVDGTSMLPALHRDDLVLLRAAHSYRVGDVVAYHSALIHRVVLHRIVAINNGRYTFKGDNNTFLDPEHPARQALIGKRWVVVPSAGRLVGMLRTPIVAALFAAVLVLLFGFAGARTRREEA
jgi:signal peptidase I